jgi:hypothetical protein
MFKIGQLHIITCALGHAALTHSLDDATALVTIDSGIRVASTELVPRRPALIKVPLRGESSDGAIREALGRANKAPMVRIVVIDEVWIAGILDDCSTSLIASRVFQSVREFVSSGCLLKELRIMTGGYGDLLKAINRAFQSYPDRHSPPARSTAAPRSVRPRV